MSDLHRARARVAVEVQRVGLLVDQTRFPAEPRAPRASFGVAYRPEVSVRDQSAHLAESALLSRLTCVGPAVCVSRAIDASLVFVASQQAGEEFAERRGYAESENESGGRF